MMSRFQITRIRSLGVFTLIMFCLSALSCGPDLSDSQARPTPDPANSELELSGVYSIEGSAEHEKDPYKGILTVTNQEDVYKFEWQTNRSRHGGVGVQMGDAVAATYAQSGNGKGCGVALYRIGSDGSLDGSIANWGEFTFGSEKAERVEGNTFEGKYNVTGTTNDGQPYEGTIKVEKNGGGYQFTWDTGRERLGYGIWRGDRAAISFGGYNCLFAIYQVRGARSLDGYWGSQRDIGFGTETAKRQ
jgi:hypothetical protein